MITAVILVGGLGTRLAPIISSLPKALAPIQGISFLNLILNQLKDSQIISKVILALGYKAEMVKSHLEGHSYPFEIVYSVEVSPLGTGGALLNAMDHVSSDPFLVMNGDSFFDISLHSFLHFFEQASAEMAVACNEVDDVQRYGEVEIDPSSQRILSFKEKSSVFKSGWVNAGLYLMRKNILLAFRKGVHSLEKDFFPVFLKHKIFAYCKRAEFIDIGTPSSYYLAQEILKPWIQI